MKSISNHLPNSKTILATALLGAIPASMALATDPKNEDPVVQELTQTKSTVELGVGDVTDSSYKFGEYNGLQKQGAYVIGAIDVRGGDSYDSNSANHWRIIGSNLGLDNRNVFAEYANQGLFRINIGFDELRRNRSDGYATPYAGVGTNILTLPSSWMIPLVPRVSATAVNARGLSNDVANSGAIVAGVVTAPTTAQLATSSAIIAADVPSFTNHNLYTTRDRYSAGATVNVTPQWEFAVNATRENKDGIKPMGSVTRTTGGDISTILPDPINQTTDQLTTTVGYRSKSNFVQVGYYASNFTNNITSLTWTNWAAPTASMTMSSAPSNQLHQLTLTAGHDFTKSTRLVANTAYSRGTQNATFLTDSGTPWVPVSSLEGLVVTKSATLKLTSRFNTRINVGAAYKYDERDNRTAVHSYGYYDANNAASTTNVDAAFSTALGVPATLLANNININANRPYSRRLNQATVDANLRLTASQALKLSDEWQKIERWCNGSWIDCADAATTKENSIKLEWRTTFNTISTHVGYTFARRTVDAYNENAFLALVPMANISPSTATGGESAYSFMLKNAWTGYGPVTGYSATTGNMNLFFPANNALANASYANGNRISELVGMRRYNMADRDRNRVRADLDWQPVETFSVQTGLDYRKDKYNDSRYGITNMRDWSANIEGSYNPNENFVFTLFYTHQNQVSDSAGNSYTANSATASVNGFTSISGGCYATIALRNASNKIDPCLDWAAGMLDKTDLYGFSFDRKHLFISKLDAGGQIIVMRAQSDNNVSGGNYANNPFAVTGATAGTTAAYFIPTAPLPTVTTTSLEIRLHASYSFNAAAMLRASYLYSHLTATDYAYDGFQFGGLSGVLPTNEIAPHYSVSVFGVSYVQRF